MRRAFVVGLAVFAACVNSSRDFITTHGTISGRVIKGPVSGAVVTATEAMSGDEVGTAITDADGAFVIDVGVAIGDLRVCASGGEYIEEATGTSVEIGTRMLCAPVLGFEEAKPREGVVITPWTHLVSMRAHALVSFFGVLPYPAAVAQAREEITALLACGQGPIELLDAMPLDPTVAQETQDALSPGLLSGILLAGLSHQAKMISEARDLTPGVSVTAIALANAYGDDLIADGFFDGDGPTGALAIEGYEIDSTTIRGAQEGFAQGVRGFLLSERNATGIAPADLHDLLTCLASATGPLFADGVVGELDFAGPAIVINTPTEGASVSGTVNVHVSASDLSDVDDLWFDPAPGLTPALPVIVDNTAEISAVLATADIADGTYVLVVRSRDVLGNVSEATRAVQINNNAPVIVLDAPEPNAAVSGVQVITAHAEDPQGVTSLVLLAPEGLTDVDSEAASLQISWDTTTHLDGTLVLELEAEDSEANVGSAGFPVVIDNNEPGSVAGIVALDTPIGGAKVQVFAYAGGYVGNLLGSGNVSPNGAFDVALPDTYAGPVLVRAYGAGATFTSVATGEPVTFSTNDELLLTVDYTPSPAGCVLEDLVLDALTTLATDLANAYVADGLGFTDARELAYGLVAEHLQRPESFELESTPPSDFSADPLADSAEAQKVGLLHVGLSRFGAEVAADADLPRTAITTLDMIALLRRDLEDGVFNGRDGKNALIPVYGSRMLVTNTLRSDVALAIVRWLDNEPLSDGTPGTNETSLVAANYAQTDGVLDLMAKDQSQLFGPDAVMSFDIFGPAISITVPAANAALRGDVTLAATAADPSGVVAMAGYVDGAPSAAIGSDQNASSDAYSAIVTTTALSNGPHKLRVVAKDERDNVSIVDRAVVVDNAAPSVTVSAPALVVSGAITITGSASDAHSGVAKVEAFVNANPTPAATQNAPSVSYSMPVTIPCNAESTVTVVATDEAGLTAQAQATVRCDNRAPALSLGPSQYYPKDSVDIVLPTNDEEWRYDNNGPSVNLHLEDWSSAPGPKLTVYFNKLDYLPATFSTIGDNNLPWLFLVPDDASQSGTNVSTAMSGLVVHYRYFFNQSPIATRDWTPLQYSVSRSGFVLPLSYQTLGPDLADATGTNEHRIVVRVRDSAGNETTRDFFFRVEAVSPPVIYKSCSLGELDGRDLAADDVYDWFVSDHPSFFEGTLFFPRLPPGSLAPWRYDVAASAVSLTFEEIERRQAKTTAFVPACAWKTREDHWCTSGVDGVAGTSVSCWPEIDEQPLRMWTDGPQPEVCWPGLWSDTTPNAPIGPTLGSQVIAGVLDLLAPSNAPWSYDEDNERWVMPENWLDWSFPQPLVFTVRSEEARPNLQFADAEVDPFPSTSIAIGNGVDGFLVRTFHGYDLLRQWEGDGVINYHWSRLVTAYEYIGKLRATAAPVTPSVNIEGVGPVDVESFDGCGADLIQDMEE